MGKDTSKKDGFLCSHCEKTFVRERSFLNHMCEKKRRWILKDEKHVKLAFYAFQEFYRIGFNIKKDYKDFIQSQYYSGFVKFGKHLCNICVIEPEEFVSFVLKTGLRIDVWCKDWVYEEFVRYQTSRESFEKAVERNILLMKQWSTQNNFHWTDFFKEISTTLAVSYIKSGRISPWVLYNSTSGLDLLNRMSDEELGLVAEYINPSNWQKKFDKYSDEVEFIKKVCDEAGF